MSHGKMGQTYDDVLNVVLSKLEKFRNSGQSGVGGPMTDQKSISELPKIIEIYKMINAREKYMMARLQQIEDLKRDVNQDRFELVAFYREFTKCAYDCSGGSTAFLNNMLTSGQETTEEQHTKAIDFLNGDD